MNCTIRMDVVLSALKTYGADACLHSRHNSSQSMDDPNGLSVFLRTGSILDRLQDLKQNYEQEGRVEKDLDRPVTM